MLEEQDLMFLNLKLQKKPLKLSYLSHLSKPEGLEFWHRNLHCFPSLFHLFPGNNAVPAPVILSVLAELIFVTLFL